MSQDDTDLLTLIHKSRQELTDPRLKSFLAQLDQLEQAAATGNLSIETLQATQRAFYSVPPHLIENHITDRGATAADDKETATRKLLVEIQKTITALEKKK